MDKNSEFIITGIFKYSYIGMERNNALNNEENLPIIPLALLNRSNKSCVIKFRGIEVPK